MRGPILVLGASGFIGANLLRLTILKVPFGLLRDLFPLASLAAGRPALPKNLIQTDLLVDANLDSLLEHRPAQDRL